MSAISANLSFSIENILGFREDDQQRPPLQEEVEEKLDSGLPKDDKQQRRRRRRILFTESQVDILKSAFAKQKYPSDEGRKKLAESLNLSPKQVKTWFQNYRYKMKCSRQLLEGLYTQAVEGHEVTGNLLGRTAMATSLRIPHSDRQTALVRNPYYSLEQNSSINQLNMLCDRYSLMNHSYRSLQSSRMYPN